MGDAAPPVTVVGLGPAGLDRVSPPVMSALLDPGVTVVVRTLHHPACAELAEVRAVVSCDDLYDSALGFDEVYRSIASRVLAAAPVVYAVPGSAVVGERSVGMIRQAASAAGTAVTIHPGESFLDLVWERTGCDPIADGVQVVDGRALPDPLQLHLPTVVTQVDRPEVLGDVVVALGHTLPHDVTVTVLDALGSPDETVVQLPLHEVMRFPAGARTSLYVDPPPNGWFGLVATNRRLRSECPWDRAQTHHSLVRHLIEETYETVDVIETLPPGAPGDVGDGAYGEYAALEEELGDLLLQVVFHATLAEETGAFGVEEVAESIRRKLVHRHPHVFGDVAADDAETVVSNWERIKSDEKDRSSLMDDVPHALPALARADKLQRRAASAGFDWDSAAPVLAKLVEEVEELSRALDDPQGRSDELGDVIFSAVNLARHLDVDPEAALRGANARFAHRFRLVESHADRPLHEMTLAELDTLWERAKQQG